MLALLISSTSLKDLICFLKHITDGRNSNYTSLVLAVLPDGDYAFVKKCYLERRRSGVFGSIVIGLLLEISHLFIVAIVG